LNQIIKVIIKIILIDREEDDYVKEINALQKELRDKNAIIIDKIKESDSDMTQKLANKKYLEHEAKKLTLKEQHMEEYWKNEMHNFETKYADAIKKCKE